MKLNAIVLSLGLLLLVQGSSAESLYEYFFARTDYPLTISKSMQLVAKNKDRIVSLLSQVSGRKLFLPTDSAWDSNPGAFQAILNEEEEDAIHYALMAFRQAQMKAIYVEVPPSDTITPASVQAYAQSTGGLTDSAYGLVYILLGDLQVCMVEWNGGDYVDDGCASIVGAPVVLSDATVYQVDSLLIPVEFKNLLQSFASKLRDS